MKALAILVLTACTVSAKTFSTSAACQEIRDKIKRFECARAVKLGEHYQYPPADPVNRNDSNGAGTTKEPQPQPKEYVSLRNGFSNVPFGTNQDTAWKRLTERYQPQVTFKSLGSSMFVLENFPLGDKVVLVFLLFDQEDRFFKYEIHAPKHTANDFDPRVMEDCQFLNRIFRVKYASPDKVFDYPSITEISDNYLKLICVWVDGQIKAETGITSYEAEYYAKGQVSDTILEAAYRKRAEQLRNAEAEKAATQF